MTRNVALLSAAIALILASAAPAVRAQDGWTHEIRASDTWDQALARIGHSKAVIELSDASIIIEVNSTDGDAGFQVFLDGEGWRKARVFEPSGQQVLAVFAAGGAREIGGGTELFLETEEPEYDDLDGLQELIELLPEGEYMFLARTTEGEWAIGSAELTHVVPAGPELVQPLPEEGEECASDVPTDIAVITWNPVQTTIQGSPDIDIVKYQIIVEDEEAELVLDMTVDADINEVTVPREFLTPDTEYKFEVLAIEESGNQTISESCFETAE